MQPEPLEYAPEALLWAMRDWQRSICAKPPRVHRPLRQQMCELPASAAKAASRHHRHRDLQARAWDVGSTQPARAAPAPKSRGPPKPPALAQ